METSSYFHRIPKIKVKTYKDGGEGVMMNKPTDMNLRYKTKAE